MEWPCVQTRASPSDPARWTIVTMHLVDVMSRLHQLGVKMQATVHHQVYCKAMQRHTLQRHHGSAFNSLGQSISGLNPARDSAGSCSCSLLTALERVATFTHIVNCVSKNLKRVSSSSKHHFYRANGLNPCPVENSSSRVQRVSKQPQWVYMDTCELTLSSAQYSITTTSSESNRSYHFQPTTALCQLNRLNGWFQFV